MNGNDLRQVMRSFATGVCVITTCRNGPDGRRHDAMTANSLQSLSLDPPLVSLSFARDSRFLADLLASHVWAVSILGEGQEELARQFARGRAAREGDVTTLVTGTGPRTGAAVVGSASWLECVYTSHLDVGDHVLVIGEVVAVDATANTEPLIFVHGTYHSLGKATRQEKGTPAAAFR
ncbi:oxidoreductase [Frankia sp. CcI49]|uniref:flavin reductase family protein n=1 Tax=unclassified Frankia TaxID=2632575 RepID=UPI0006CA30F0|nr:MULTISPECIES: flavin reductase family protein [unclassified Frankia]KPM52228.1 oxidoreductase [Frankia sp. R43]ONH51710.1 oxidoreductase [Frankia sp. CcI49]